MATLADVVHELQSQKKHNKDQAIVQELELQRVSSDKNSESSQRTLTSVKASIMKLIEATKPSMADKESLAESRRSSKSAFLNRASSGGLMGGVKEGLGIPDVGSWIGGFLVPVWAASKVALFAAGLTAATALRVGGFIWAAPLIGDLVESLLKNTLASFDLPLIGSDPETVSAVSNVLGNVVEWGIYGKLVGAILGKRIGLLFAIGGTAYSSISDWLEKDAGTQGTWANWMTDGWNEMFGTDNGKQAITGIGTAIATAVSAWVTFWLPSQLKYLNPFAKTPLPPADPMRDPTNLRTAAPPRAPSVNRPVSRFDGRGLKLGQSGLNPSMFKSMDLEGRGGKQLSGAALEARMQKLAKAGQILPEALNDVMKTPWWKTFGSKTAAVLKGTSAIASKVAIPLQAVMSAYNVKDESSILGKGLTSKGIAGETLALGTDMLASFGDLASFVANTSNKGINLGASALGYNGDLMSTNANFGDVLRQGVVDVTQSIIDTSKKVAGSYVNPAKITALAPLAPPRADNSSNPGSPALIVSAPSNNQTTNSTTVTNLQSDNTNVWDGWLPKWATEW
jgi:hypothetical protein